jgi:hypothetical protein
MNRVLAARIAKLEARHNTAANKPKGVIGSKYGHLIVDPERQGHFKLSAPPEGFAEYARNQQQQLLAELVELATES